MNDNNVTYFDSFGVEHIPKEIKAFINNKNIKTNIFRIEAYHSVMCGYFVLDLLILCLQVKNRLIILIRFHQITLRRVMI